MLVSSQYIISCIATILWYESNLINSCLIVALICVASEWINKFAAEHHKYVLFYTLVPTTLY